LIEDLVKNTPPEHPDAENLAKALSKVKVVAEQVDAAISEAKNRESMLKIQKRLFDMNVFEAGRYFIREGIVHKICRKSHQEKNLFLFNDAILYATEMPGGRLVKPTMLMLHTTAVKDLPDDRSFSTWHFLLFSKVQNLTGFLLFFSFFFFFVFSQEKSSQCHSNCKR
jgi:hypothetical protein